MSAILVKLLKKFDEPARHTTIKYIDGCYSNPDKFGVDLLINGGNTFNNIEVQTLNGARFIDPYNILTIFKRKDRYSLNTIYITYNRTYTKCFCFCRVQLNPEKMSTINARYSIHDQDAVYYLEKDEVLMIDNINKENFNVEILNDFFERVNARKEEED